MTRTLGQLQEGAQGVSEAAKTSLTRTIEDLHSATRSAIEESKQTASATVADMLETHGMLRSDTTALFERLREANILLQEVLSGAHENMSSLERTMVTRVSEFVAAMNDVGGKSDTAAAAVEKHLGTFNAVTRQVLGDLGELADRVQHPRALARRSGRACGEKQSPQRGVDCRPPRQHRDVDRDAGRADRGFRPAAAAFLQPAGRVARRGVVAGERNRRHRCRDEQRERAGHRTAVRARPHHIRGRAQAHQRNL